MALSQTFSAPLPPDRVHQYVDAFLKTPNSIYIGHIASAAVLLYIASQNPAVPVWFLYVWAFLELIGYPVLMEVWRQVYLRKERSKRNPYLWIKLMDVLSLMVGTSWGVMSFISLNPDNAAHFAIQMSIAAGATAAAVRSLAIFPRSFILYVIPFLGLLALRIMLLGDDFILLGGLVVIFMLMLLRFGSDVMESVSQYIDISTDNLDLAQRYRDAAAEADHANREKTRLLAAASHDLRQPIHAIGLYIETLPLDKMDERSRTTLERIRSSLQTLSKLFNSLLDVSLLDSGKVQVRPRLFDLEDMLNHVLDDYEPLAEIAHVTLMLECPKVGVMGDAILVRRMVQNLLSNAIRHAEGGSVRIHVEQYHGEEGDRLSIAVIDDGPGIAKEHQAVIFEEFTQISRRAGRVNATMNSTDNQQKGLGLGLAIVRRLADLQDLSLDLQTSPDGTCIKILNFRAEALKPHSKKREQASAKMGARFHQKRILLVDDDRETLKATEELLAKWGCRVSAAANLAEFATIQGPFDLIVSDYAFEDDFTGIEVVEAARSRFGADLRALIISGDSSEYVQQRVKDKGLLLIQKPVQPVQLRSAMLDRFLSSHAGEQILS
ncbi:ATP-binding response regulator [Cohaesibacter intestini]|uniref:ATP-binding response regulator n=1 Tax=Cohaesibacter intestini TaxID=2211145 RepID=UPI000DE9B5C0|nr:hybrid sensor histidine kinase/response regulator [Cohaesibacter intestini]